MRVVLSANLSYCFGVRKTIALVEDLLARHPERAFYMYGEIVHNETVIAGLRAKGLRMIRSLDETDPGGSVVIPSHGAALHVFEELRERKIDVIDATCPMVRVIQAKARRLEEEGCLPVIIGDPLHDEVRGIAGHVTRAVVLRTPADATAERFAGVTRAGVVVQSTFIQSEAEAIVEALRRVVPEVRFENTICRPTLDRQEEVRSVAGLFDTILVVGSWRSANTRHLFDLAGGGKARVHLVDDPEKVPGLPIPPEASVFITSGASTPISAIERVVELLEKGQSGRPPEAGRG